MIRKTPPMGWNTWNTFGPNINEKIIMEAADARVEKGLLDAGYDISDQAHKLGTFYLHHGSTVKD